MSDFGIGDVIEWTSWRGKREVLRIVEEVNGGVRALRPDSAPDGGVLLSNHELNENARLLFHGGASDD